MKKIEILLSDKYADAIKRNQDIRLDIENNIMQVFFGGQKISEVRADTNREDADACLYTETINGNDWLVAEQWTAHPQKAIVWSVLRHLARQN